MRREDSRYPKDWFRIGERELRRAKYLLNGGDLEGAGFNIQQAVEKYLKGYLLYEGWELRRIHNLETLINEAIRYDTSFERFRPACQKITQYYVSTEKVSFYAHPLIGGASSPAFEALRQAQGLERSRKAGRQDAAPINRDFLRLFQDSHYMEERYPFMVASELTEHEIKESLTAAEDIIEKVKGLV